MHEMICPYHETNIGVPQGDCLSPVLFTLYLSQALKSPRNEDHSYAQPPEEQDLAIPPHLKDHTYATPRNTNFSIDQQYADDISYISNTKHTIEHRKATIPSQLKKRNLNVNIGKTEEYHIRREGNEDWKKCKYLGSLLDTKSDISRRKGLAISTYNKVKHILDSKKLTLDIKLRVFDTYISSVFLYNCELWTLTKALEQEIDIFQRKQLRRLLNISWPRKRRNEELYEITKMKKWSVEIKRRRLSWLGHLLRLPDETPAKQSLYESLRKVKKPRGKSKLTWLGLINSDLKCVGLHTNDITELLRIANDRQAWKGIIGIAMSGTDESA